MQIKFTIYFLADLSGLKIWRYEDAELGARKLPVFDDYQQGKVLLESGVFAVDVAKKSVVLTTADAKRIDVGTSLVYVVE